MCCSHLYIYEYYFRVNVYYEWIYKDKNVCAFIYLYMAIYLHWTFKVIVELLVSPSEFCAPHEYKPALSRCNCVKCNVSVFSPDIRISYIVEERQQSRFFLCYFIFIIIFFSFSLTQTTFFSALNHKTWQKIHDSRAALTVLYCIWCGHTQRDNEVYVTALAFSTAQHSYFSLYIHLIFGEVFINAYMCRRQHNFNKRIYDDDVKKSNRKKEEKKNSTE